MYFIHVFVIFSVFYLLKRYIESLSYVNIVDDTIVGFNGGFHVPQ